jgi:large repetitive protein
MKQIVLLYLVVNIFCVNITFAQLQITTTQTANQLVKKLVGPGVIYTNPTLTCPSFGKGSFKNGMTTTVAMDSGVVLTTGRATQVANAQTFFADNNNSTSGGDANLQAVATGAIFDLCKLEFDFVPIGDTIKFNYRFGSEEYPGYTCSNFNDVFSFFISGNGYPVPKNIAIIPNTNCPVSINTINGSNSNPCGNVNSPCAPPNNALFISANAINNVVYSGMTKKLTAIAAVTPCSTYHMKFAIADVKDEKLDSGVFLEANSFISEAVTISNVTSTNSSPSSNPFTIEGCNAAIITLSRPYPKSFSQTVLLSYAGTAINGIDYVSPPTTIVIPANATSASFNVTSLTDNISEGTETIKILVNGALCSTLPTDSVLVNINEYPTYSVSDNDTICFGQSSILSASNNPIDTNLSFQWSNAGSTIGNGNSIVVNPTNTTTYTLSAMYAGCPQKDSSILISVEPIPTISLTATNVTCFGLTDGKILASGNVSFNPIQFSILPNSVSQNGSPTTFNNLSIGTYTVTITSGIGCTSTSTTTIAQPLNLSWSSVTQTNLVCNQPTSGSIQASAIGGNFPIIYDINPNTGSAIGGNFSNLNLNTFTITATDAKLCSISSVVILAQPPSPIISLANANSVLCFGDNSATIQTLATSINGAVNYLLLPTNVSNSTGVFTNLTTGNYTVVVSDAGTCTSSSVLLVSSPSAMNWSNVQVTNVTCNGLQNGIIQVQASGGVGAINYAISPSSAVNTNGLFDSLSPQNYIITAKDANNCTLTTSISISQPSSLQITNISATLPSCLPGNDASLTIINNGGTPAYSYQLNGNTGGSSNVFNGLTNTAYTIKVSDAKGCSVTSIYNISSPQNPNINSITLTQASCIPGCDAMATINMPSGSTFAYSLNGSAFQLNSTMNGLCINNYTISVKDANNCTVTSTINITGISSPTISSFNQSNILCNGSANGSLQLNTIGGIGSVTYYLLPNGIANLSGNFSNLAANAYVVIAKDANNCSVSMGVTILEPPILSIDSLITSNPNCYNANNGTIVAFASGGTGILAFSISPSASLLSPNMFNNLNGNMSYLVSVTDSNNCVASVTKLITQPTALSFNNFSFQNMSCHNVNDGKINASAVGGTGTLNYLLQPNGITNNNGFFSNLTSGNYSITVTDANACTLMTIVSINNPSPLLQQNLITTNITCYNQNNGIAQLQVNGGTGIISYNIQPLGITNTTGFFSNLSPNTFTIMASDANACSLSVNVTFTNPTSLTFTNLTTTNLLCATYTNANISANANGGTGSLLYSLMPPNITTSNGQFNNLGIGNYMVKVTDANACTISSNVVITSPPLLDLSLQNFTNISCHDANDASINTLANGGAGSNLFTLLPSTLSNTTGSWSNLQEGNYTIHLQDQNGCKDSISNIIITNPTAITILNTISSSIQCYGDSTGQIFVTTNGGTNPISYAINPNTGVQNMSGIFSSLNANVYSIIASDANSCSTSTSVTVYQNSALQVFINQAKSPSCFNTKDGSIALTAIGGQAPYIFNLNATNANTNGVFSNLLGGDYVISIQDAQGCSYDTLYTLKKPPDIILTELKLLPILCKNSTLGSMKAFSFGGLGNLQYLLKPLSNTNTSGEFNNLQNGIYTLHIQDSTGCALDSIIDLKPPTPFYSKIVAKEVSCYGFGSDASAEITVIGGTPPYKYNWKTTPPQSSARIEKLIAGWYFIDIKDDNDCALKDSIRIAEGTCCQQVFIPNVFSPNGDDKNETFSLISSADMEIKQFEVYNRWGNRVWFTFKKSDEWDGRIKGAAAESGTYFYILKYKCLADQVDYLRKGDVILIR